MAYVSKNNAYSTLAANVAAADTSLAVAAGHGDRFPVVAGSDYTYVTLEDTSGNIEIVKVTARASASDTMTIVRAQEGTTARAWNSGDVVEHRLTAGVMEAGLNAANDLATHLNDTADAHDASAISYAGGTGMSATDVEAAIDELATEKLNAADAFLNSVLAKTAAYTVVAADRDKLIDCDGTFTLTLTAAATLGTGFVFGVRNSGTGVITIDADGTEKIDGVETIAIKPGSSLFIHVNGGATAWNTLLWDAPAFAKNQSKAADGYLKLPGGLIIQWGDIAASSTAKGAVTVTFPIEFPTDLFNVQCQQTSSSTSDVISAWSESHTRTSIVLHGVLPDNMIHWLAIGH